MIIEIKNLPKDRNIKKVMFEIEFENGEISTVTQIDNKYNTTFETQEESIPTTNKIEPMFIPVVEEREKKDVPSEMIDMEF